MCTWRRRCLHVAQCILSLPCSPSAKLCMPKHNCYSLLCSCTSNCPVLASRRQCINCSVVCVPCTLWCITAHALGQLYVWTLAVFWYVIVVVVSCSDTLPGVSEHSMLWEWSTLTPSTA